MWGAEAEDLSPRVQQAPKPGESLELPLGPPVRLKRFSEGCSVDVVRCTVDVVRGCAVLKCKAFLWCKGPWCHLLCLPPQLTQQGDYILGGCQGSLVTYLSASLWIAFIIKERY